jgi:hypothetical protein
MQLHRWEVINGERSSWILRYSIRSPYYPVRSGLGVVSDRYVSPHESA